MIGPNYNRGTNMHLIPLTEEAEIDELEQLQAGTSWIIAAILGAVLIGKLTKPGIPGPNQPENNYLYHIVPSTVPSSSTLLVESEYY